MTVTASTVRTPSLDLEVNYCTCSADEGIDVGVSIGEDEGVGVAA